MSVAQQGRQGAVREEAPKSYIGCNKSFMMITE